MLKQHKTFQLHAGALCLCETGLRETLHYSYLADASIQSKIQLIRLSGGQTPLEKCGVKGLDQGPRSCTDLTVATLGLEPQTTPVPSPLGLRLPHMEIAVCGHEDTGMQPPPRLVVVGLWDTALGSHGAYRKEKGFPQVLTQFTTWLSQPAT